jgi:hypothetical protein
MNRNQRTDNRGQTHRSRPMLVAHPMHPRLLLARARCSSARLHELLASPPAAHPRARYFLIVAKA